MKIIIYTKSESNLSNLGQGSPKDHLSQNFAKSA